MSVSIAGLPISTMPLAEAADWICSIAVSGKDGCDVHLVNAWTIALAENDDAMRSALIEAGANFADGRPLTWVARLRRTRLRQVRGPSLFEEVLDRGRASGVRHYLLGTTVETLRSLERELHLRYPGVVIAGSESPPFRPLTADEIASQDRRIRDCEADIVWVGLGTPKQDFEAARVAKSTGTVSVAVGAAFDFVAGTKAEAPGWMSPLGIEWLFRFASEPRRLWRRYTLGNVTFVRAVLRRR